LYGSQGLEVFFTPQTSFKSVYRHQVYEKGCGMKHFFLFTLILIFSGAMALASVSPQVTAHGDRGIEKIADLQKEKTPSASPYSVSGDRQGIVTVKDAVSSEVIRTFKMDGGNGEDS
jgi:hypothetical protein